MKTLPIFFLGLLFPAYAFAGAQYTAEDIIRYFRQTEAAARAEHAAQTSGLWAKGSGHGTVAGAPPAATSFASSPDGIVIGAPAGDRPLVIPMTGAKAGYMVNPAPPLAARPTGYDLLVTFELDSARLTPQARENLDTFARALRDPALAGLRFAVEGHTDSSGSPGHNLKLSEARAASVVAYLLQHGIPRHRLTASGHGETRPRLADPAHPGNRRVETRRID